MNFAEDLPDETPKHKTWYRHGTTGDRGFMVNIDDMDMIQLDRPQEVVRRPFIAGEWNIETEHRPLTIAQVGEIAFMADKQLCQARGEHELARRDWHGLSDAQRIKWMNVGPKDDPLRADLWKATMGVIRHRAD